MEFQNESPTHVRCPVIVGVSCLSTLNEVIKESNKSKTGEGLGGGGEGGVAGGRSHLLAGLLPPTWQSSAGTASVH